MLRLTRAVVQPMILHASQFGTRRDAPLWLALESTKIPIIECKTFDDRKYRFEINISQSKAGWMVEGSYLRQRWFHSHVLGRRRCETRVRQRRWYRNFM